MRHDHGHWVGRDGGAQSAGRVTLTQTESDLRQCQFADAEGASASLDGRVATGRWRLIGHPIGEEV